MIESEVGVRHFERQPVIAGFEDKGRDYDLAMGKTLETGKGEGLEYLLENYRVLTCCSLKPQSLW